MVELLTTYNPLIPYLNSTPLNLKAYLLVEGILMVILLTILIFFRTKTRSQRVDALLHHMLSAELGQNHPSNT